MYKNNNNESFEFVTPETIEKRSVNWFLKMNYTSQMTRLIWCRLLTLIRYEYVKIYGITKSLTIYLQQNSRFLLTSALPPLYFFFLSSFLPVFLHFLPLSLKTSQKALQLGQLIMYYTPKKVLPFAFFFNLPGLQKPERNRLSDKSGWAIYDLTLMSGNKQKYGWSLSWKVEAFWF